MNPIQNEIVLLHQQACQEQARNAWNRAAEENNPANAARQLSGDIERLNKIRDELLAAATSVMGIPADLLKAHESEALYRAQESAAFEIERRAATAQPPHRAP